MAKQANRMMIGGFVVIAIFLLAASVVIFGSGRFFRKTDTYVLHFVGSIKGLNVGAPVLFQGVQIGSVSRIVMRTDREKLTTDIPVFIAIEPDRFEVVDARLERRDPRETLPKLIDNGLRAVLSMQSYITGQLLIELDYYPDTPVTFKEDHSGYLEIPTIKSTSERLYQTLQNIDLESLARHLESTMAGVDKFVNNPDLGEGIRALRKTVEEMQSVVGKVDAEVSTMADDLEGTLDDTRKLITKIDSQVDPVSADLQKTLEEFGNLARNTDDRLEKLSEKIDMNLAGIKGVLSEDAPLIINLEDTLRDVSAMSRSMRQLADYLEQHPEALIQGKKEYEGK